MKLLCERKKDYFSNIDIKSASDTKKFWKKNEPYFSNKKLNSNKIFLSEKGRLIKDPVSIATTINDYFANITQTVGLKQFQFDHLKGNAQFFHKVTFEPLMDLKQNYYGSWKYYKNCYF